MNSKAAMRQAESSCQQQQHIFASIKDKCMSYVRINESILGPFATQIGAVKLFLMWVRSEFDHLVNEDTAQRNQKAWISASTSNANKRSH